jgi:outer membrane murein-binding lipoprotein Lpp
MKRQTKSGVRATRLLGMISAVLGLFALAGCGPSPEQVRLNKMKDELKAEKTAIEAEKPKLDALEAKLDQTSADLKVKEAGLKATVAIYKGRGAPPNVVKKHKADVAAFNKEVNTHNAAVQSAKTTFAAHNAKVDAYNARLNEAIALNKQINGPSATLTTSSIVVAPRVRIRRM